MSRKEEYQALLSALERTPDALENTVRKACARKKALQKKRRIFEVPAGALAVCFVGFMLLVNLFPPFARACGDVPVLRELAKAVAWSPSLSAAVEDEYVQPVDQEQTAENGVTARVEYVIADRRQLNVFYTLNAREDRLLEADVSFGGAGGTELEGFSSTGGSYGTPNGELRQAAVNFHETDMPDRLDVVLKVYYSAYDAQGVALEPAEEQSGEEAYFEESRHAPAYLAEFTFTLEFDPYFTARGEMAAVGQTFRLDGQTLILEEAEIYPTHLRLDFGYDPDNTAWLTGLEFYVENERGERFDPVRSGITASGEAASPSMGTYWMDSTYFSDSKVLTLHITQARWLEKDREKIRLNLETGAHDPLPDGAELTQIEKLSGGYLLTFREKMFREGLQYNLWQSYFDSSGTERYFRSAELSETWKDPETGEYGACGEGDGFFLTVPLPGYEDAEVWLAPAFSRIADFSDPVAVPIK